MPVPLRAITSGELVAVELIVMVPVAAPPPVGANFAVRVAVAPAAIVCPPAIPLSLNPAPPGVTLLIVMVELPEFVSVIAWVLLLPTSTVLKLKLPGFAPNVLPDVTALPVTVNVFGEPTPLPVKVMPPLIPIVDCGVNGTLNVVDWFGAIPAGRPRPFIPTPVPKVETAVIVRVVLPVLLRVTV